MSSFHIKNSPRIQIFRVWIFIFYFNLLLGSIDLKAKNQIFLNANYNLPEDIIEQIIPSRNAVTRNPYNTDAEMTTTRTRAPKNSILTLGSSYQKECKGKCRHFFKWWLQMEKETKMMLNGKPGCFDETASCNIENATRMQKS